VTERLKVDVTGGIIADRILWAKSPGARARGILGRRLRAREALIIDGGRQVHTFGLRDPIDVVFCDEHWIVLHVVRAMKPLRLSRWVRRARFVIELPNEALPGDVKPGDALFLD
jgi:uncharacterized membrane protein (UPF0127 family)